MMWKIRLLNHISRVILIGGIFISIGGSMRAIVGVTNDIPATFLDYFSWGIPALTGFVIWLVIQVIIDLYEAVLKQTKYITQIRDKVF